LPGATGRTTLAPLPILPAPLGSLVVWSMTYCMWSEGGCEVEPGLPAISHSERLPGRKPRSARPRTRLARGGSACHAICSVMSRSRSLQGPSGTFWPGTTSVSIPPRVTKPRSPIPSAGRRTWTMASVYASPYRWTEWLFSWHDGVDPMRWHCTLRCLTGPRTSSKLRKQRLAHSDSSGATGSGHLRRILTGG